MRFTSDEKASPQVPSLISHLDCSSCGRKFPPGQINTFCPQCRAPLLARYRMDAAAMQMDRDAISRRPRGMWRWRELLPVADPRNIVTLGEGDTPLLRLPNQEAELGLGNLFVKDESQNPTGSFKARGLAAAVSRAKELGIQRVIIPTAGNAGGAMAAYAARAGMRAAVYMPQDTPRAIQAACQAAGAEVALVDGLISDAARLAAERAQAEGWFDLSTFKEPYRVEGKKVMGFELAEAFGWSLPDVIVYPTGGGTGLVGMWKAFDELETLGWLEVTKRPRMVAVQSSGCAPVVKAFESGAPRCEFWENAQTLALGLRVPKSFADALILDVLRQSRGSALSVSDADILQAQRRLGRAEGIFACPEGAATLAALVELVRRGDVSAHDRVVLFNTGAGVLYV